MLDIKYIREHTKEVEEGLLKRMAKGDFDLAQILDLDAQEREVLVQVEELRAERNKYSKTKPDAKTIKLMKKVGEDIAGLEKKLAKISGALQEALSALPNLPLPDVVSGGKENNEVTKTYGVKPNLDFKFKDHVELATSLGLVDYERAVKLAGSGFWAYTGLGAQLEWALLNYFIDFHIKNGFTFIWPPFLLNEESAYASGHLPKFRDDLFWTEDKLCLNATAEMMLGNWHRQEIIKEDLLPLKYIAYAPSFRREAGSYRQEERGMIRGHQFNKVEMFAYTRPEESRAMFEVLVKAAEDLVAGLGLHFQTVKLAAGDCSSAMAKTYDIEVWLPSMGIYKEVSSISNALDYQARRGGIRYKNPDTGQNEFVHTLNASGLATSRLLPAILEQNQRADGRIVIPESLRKYLPGQIDLI